MRDLHDWLDGAIPKNAKIWEDIKLGNAIVTPREKGVYELKYKDTHQTFSNKKDLVDGMNTLIKNPSDRIKLLDSSQMKHLDNHLATFHEQVVPNTNPPVRIMRESEGKMALDVQDPHTKWWVRTTPEKLSESDLAEVVSTYTGRTPAQLKEGWFKAKSAKLSDMVSPAEEKHIVDKHGSKFWDKFKWEFAWLWTTSGSFKDALIGMVPVPWIGKSKMAWKSAIAGSTAFEIFEYITSSDPMQKTYDVTTADGIRNVAGALAQVLLYKYMGWIVGTIVPNAPRIWDTATQGTRRIIDANTPATEVPAPATTQN